jgi:HTH-type transcriptional regulator/antitoxin HigA
LLIENYENQHYSIEAPDPVEAIKIRMEEMNLKQKDLIGVIGGKSSVSEILNKKKKLTLEMIRNLASKLNLSATILIRNYTLSE